MRVHGSLKRSGRWWEAEIPSMGIYTQGKSHADALRMVADAIESLVNKRGFRVDVHPIGRHELTVGAKDGAVWLPFVLKRMRTAAGLTLAEVRDRLHAKSRNTYARYEQGVSEPTLTKLEELLRVVAPAAEVVLTEAA
ncbi:MAG: helix-turn-helix transcriptional regulator [Deltaproteobacteria bacterium]|nr:helix-turn-helix transcriptional regulator [Deltaproteobacteria bacterium]